MAKVSKRLMHAFNTFTQNQPQPMAPPSSGGGSFGGMSYGSRPDRPRLHFSHERSIISSIYTRIAIDLASVHLKHVRLDDKGRYMEDIQSGLNNCLTVEANLDQAARDFRQDIAMTLCSKGYLAIVPVDTSLNPNLTSSYDILTMRVGEIVAWYPKHVAVSLYNEENGRREELVLDKKSVAVVSNPLYAIMNEPNSTLQRLIRKLNLLDSVDEVAASGKLDLIIQLPYVIKSEARRQQANQRRSDIESQLKDSSYGIAYTDGTEKITQLNRPIENNLLAQITFLTTQLYSELGLTTEVMNGTADEKTTLNYWNRTIEPMVGAISESLHRTFLTKTARSQKQAIRYFRDPFKLVPVENIAEIADKFTRNEIMSSNEIRQVIGMSPSSDPKADQLVNSNMPQIEAPAPAATPEAPVDDGEEKLSTLANDGLASVNSKIDEIFAELGGE